MPRFDDLGRLLYPFADEAREPWLERLAWGDAKRQTDKFETRGATVAVHVAWGDTALAVEHLTDDGDCDPWQAVGAGTADGAHVAVRVRGGGAVFIFADDPSSRVEGPAGEMRLDDLRAEGLVTRVSTDRHAIAMEPGVVYRTRRFGLMVTAEIVARAVPLTPPKRVARLAVLALLCLAAVAVGTAGNALAANGDPILDAHADSRDEETLARLLAEAAAEASQRPMLRSEASRAASVHRFVVGPFGTSCCLCRDRFDSWWPRGPRGIFEQLETSALRRPTRVRVRRRRLEIGGEISRASIARVLDRNVHALEHCTREADAGAVAVYLVIGADGLVRRSTVAESSLSNASAAACFADVIGGLAFEPSRGAYGASGLVTLALRARIPPRSAN